MVIFDSERHPFGVFWGGGGGLFSPYQAAREIKNIKINESLSFLTASKIMLTACLIGTTKTIHTKL